MIYTVTLNPALDYVVGVDNLALGAVNRVKNEHILYGGKGINVSYILNQLGFENRALGFVAGFTGEELSRGLESEGVRTDFIEVENGITRINVKVKSDTESEINGMGPDITADDFEGLKSKIEKLEEGDVLILSGSIPSCMPDDTYETLLELIKDKNIRTVVDATNELLLKVLKYRPFLIKPNREELGEMFGVKIKNDDDIILYASRLQKMGAVNVLVSMAKDGSLLLDEYGNVHRMGVAEGSVLNSVGAGDSMVAGFVAGYLKTGDYDYALKLGTACGGATAFKYWLADKEDIKKVYNTINGGRPYEN